MSTLIAVVDDHRCRSKNLDQDVADTARRIETPFSSVSEMFERM